MAACKSESSRSENASQITDFEPKETFAPTLEPDQ
jgi:hypothetical protein